MMALLVWLENTALGIWVRESGSLWSYPTILFLHTLGLALVVGMSTAVSLRTLGIAARLPIAPFERLYPILWLGFIVNAISGVLLLVADATTKLTNPVFYVKMVAVAGAMVMMARLRRGLLRLASPDDTSTGRPRLLAALALTCWVLAIVAGRLMAYLGPVSGAPGLMNSFPE